MYYSAYSYVGKRAVKTRKDLMDVTENCLEDETTDIGNRHHDPSAYLPRVSLKSVTRQFDNIRRVQAAYEDHLQSHGSINLVNFLEIYWLLPSLLAKV